jgi:hypothetical protein
MLLAQKASFSVKFEEQLLEIDKCKSLDNFDKGMPGKSLEVGTAKGSTGNGACSKNLAICTQSVVGLQDDNWMKLKSDEVSTPIIAEIRSYGTVASMKVGGICMIIDFLPPSTNVN